MYRQLLNVRYGRRLKVIKELQKVMGKAPQTRLCRNGTERKQESNRTESRKKQLIDLYKKCKKEEKDWMS